ncbi:MAG: TIGR02285 family protein [Methylocystaceae bacterium]|nr:TIGR02285 family protein [Methylocystaceae bacterium]
MLRLLFVIFLLGLATNSFAEPVKVIWGRTDFPPYTIVRGDNAGKGVTDQMIDFYIAHLPQYQHEKIVGSLQRVLTHMKSGHTICHGSLLWKKERTEFAEYLEPNMLVFANGVLTTKRNLKNFKPYMVDAHTIDFERLVSESHLKIRYHAERSYSDVIDDVISRYAGKSPVLVRKTGLKETDREMQLLLDGRLDAILGRPEEGLFALQELKRKNQLMFLTIKGHKPYLKTQIACAKGAWNDQFIKDVNAVTRKYRKSKIMSDYYIKWLPENLGTTYRQLLQNVFAE